MASHLSPFTPVSQTGQSRYIVDHAKGITVYDTSGKTYLDGLSGLWCVNIGYGDQRLVEAMQQTSTEVSFAQTMLGVSHKNINRLADKLISLSPGDCMRKVFFGHSGSDANDTNMKLARLYFLTCGQPQRKKFISRHRAYHGTTFTTANISGLDGHHRNFALPDGPYIHVSAPDVFRGLNELGFDSEEAYADSLVAEIESVILNEGPDTIAAFVAEPIMAVGGVLIPPRTYFPKVKKLLDKFGVLLLMDDVVCSFGRLGYWFGWEATGIQPDLVSIAKGFTSGYIPMSASIIGHKVWSLIEEHREKIGMLGHGFTLSGHPVAAAVALANIDVIEKDGLLDASKEQGMYLRDALRKRLGILDCVRDIRGLGMLVAVELADHAVGVKASALPGAMAVAVVNRCLVLGLVVRTCPGRDIVALAPPLIATTDDIDTMVDIMDKSIQGVLRRNHR